MSISSLIYILNSLYRCYLPYFDNSKINSKFLLDQPIHNYEYFS